MTANPAEHAVERRAFELWEADGSPEGGPAAYWALARASLAEAEQATAAAAAQPTLPTISQVIGGLSMAARVLLGVAAVGAGTAKAGYEMWRDRQRPGTDVAPALPEIPGATEERPKPLRIVV